MTNPSMKTLYFSTSCDMSQSLLSSVHSAFAVRDNSVNPHAAHQSEAIEHPRMFIRRNRGQSFLISGCCPPRRLVIYTRGRLTCDSCLRWSLVVCAVCLLSIVCIIHHVTAMLLSCLSCPFHVLSPGVCMSLVCGDSPAFSPSHNAFLRCLVDVWSFLLLYYFFFFTSLILEISVHSNLTKNCFLLLDIDRVGILWRHHWVTLVTVSYRFFLVSWWQAHCVVFFLQYFLRSK